MKDDIKDYRTGIFGALLDEHDKAFAEFEELVNSVSEDQYTMLVDEETDDESCRSIQTISTHLIGSVYGYAYLMREAKKVPYSKEFPEQIPSIKQVSTEWNRMMKYMIETLDYLNEHKEEPWKFFITTQSGRKIDIETLLEHSVVHILRHRRQIEKFILRMKS